MLTISATFTAEPIQEVLQFWLTKIGLDLSLHFTDYNQVFQQLLDPASLVSQNADGINLFLIRIDDWVRFLPSDGSGLEHVEAESADIDDTLKYTLEQTTQEFIDAVCSASQKSLTPYLIAFCPPTPNLSLERRVLYDQLEQSIVESLTSIQGVYLMRSTDMLSKYAVKTYYDPKRDRMGHVPYNELAFTAIGTALARQIYALKRHPYKVIALDCDHTLWRGVCGEDGPLGVCVDAPFKALQSLMVRCSEAGFLLCLCSKNVEEDVWQVFDQQNNMPLSRNHIVAWRVNWQSKSENLRSLADELNLGLDSFIFIDDNPVECSEVQANLPQVLTLNLPNDPTKIEGFLNHIWPLDILKITDTDKQRIQLYKQNIERKRFEQGTTDFNAFIAGLQLDIQITPPSADQIARVSQLTQRTNQFNATSHRYSESEIRQMCKTDNYGCRVVIVKDRFGDYGLVGLVMFQIQSHILNVDTFLLSCRVLGRGVEHRMVAHLGQIAAEHDLKSIVLNFQPTPKNLPAQNFFTSICPSCQPTIECGYQYILSTQVAQELTFQSQVSLPPIDKPALKFADADSHRDVAVSQSQDDLALWNHIARELQYPTQILNTIVEQTRRHRQPTTIDWIPPSTATEKKLSQIWSEVLRIDQISLTDNFFDLGGTSLLAVIVFAEIETVFNKQLPITILLEAPTLEKLASVIDSNQEGNDTWSPLVTVQAKGSKLPLYLVHGGFGDVLGMARISQFLDDDQPLYTLRGIGLDGQQLPLLTIEAMAAEYVKAIKKNQPEGPYLLAGQCSGGVIAFEMAQQLVAQGNTVIFLGLLDTPHPQLENQFVARARYYDHKPTYRHNRWDLYYYLFTALHFALRDYDPWRLAIVIQYHWRELRKRQITDQLAYIGKYVKKLISRALAKLGVRTRQDNTRQDNRSISSAIPTSDLFSKPTLNYQMTFIKDRFFEVFLRAQDAYVPKPYPGSISFFVTLQSSYVAPRDARGTFKFYQLVPEPVSDISNLVFGWDSLVNRGNFFVHPIDSPHHLMYEDPYLQRLGEALQTDISAKIYDLPCSRDFLPSDKLCYLEI